LESALSPRENTQGFSLLNRLPALADVELPVDILQVSFDGCCRNQQFVGYLLVAQLSVKFIRWLRNNLYTNTSWMEAMGALKRIYAVF